MLTEEERALKEAQYLATEKGLAGYRAVFTSIFTCPDGTDMLVFKIVLPAYLEMTGYSDKLMASYEAAGHRRIY